MPRAHFLFKSRTERSRKAFSVVELMIAAAIIAVIAGISVYGWLRVQARAELERARFCLGALNVARTQYLGEHPFINPSATVQFDLIAPYLALSKENAPASLAAFTSGTGTGREWILGAWNAPIECRPSAY